MNVFIILWSVYAVLMLFTSRSWNYETDDLYKLAIEQGLSAEEIHLLNQLTNNGERRFKRQQVMNAARPSTISSQNLQPAECGINGKSLNHVTSPNSEKSRASPTDWPWMVVLLQTNYLEHFCGGVLLNRNYVLTAAHCVHGKTPGGIRVRLGEYDFQLFNETESKDYEIAEIKIHRDYDTATQRHDIALIRLRTQVIYGTYVRPVCLPSSRVETNQTAIVAGWGAIFYGGPFSEILLDVRVPIWDLNNCISKYAQPVFDTNICAAGYEGDKDACSGDSGGPLLMQESNGRWVNVGIVSWGIGCGNKELPGLYTSVESYLTWIKRHTRPQVS